jgi:hypothetical protein
MRLDLSKATSFKHHRHGWGFCINALMGIHSKSGIFCDDFVEKNFAWNLSGFYKKTDNNYILPYAKPWIGFMHNPPNPPKWFDYANSPEGILSRGLFKESLKSCKCLICLSDYAANWLRQKVSVPVISVKHPTSFDCEKWNKDRFLLQKTRPLVQIGYWLRNITSIRDFRCSSKYNKIWLPSDLTYVNDLLNRIRSMEKDFYEKEYMWSTVSILDKISNEQFDRLISSCVVFLNLYDSSANNAVIECIARNTPILINKIAPVVEYLGKSYPMYYNSIDEAEEMIMDTDLILSANQYLIDMDKSFLSKTFFLNDICNKLETLNV